MSDMPAPMTAEELLVYPHDHKRLELIDGVLHVMEPGNADHGDAAATLLGLLWPHVRAHRLGKVYAAETGFVLRTDPDTVRAPDVAFVTRERAEAVGRTERFWPGPPDLAIEVRSPGDTRREAAEKVAMWLEHGTRLVLVADIRARTIAVHRPGRAAAVASAGDVVDAGDVVAGWALAVDDVYE